MAISNPAYLSLFPSDPEADTTGSSEVAFPKAIGGAFNEARALVELGTGLWTLGGRGTESALRTYGEASAPAPFLTTSVASASAYEERIQIPLELSRGRTALGVDVVADDLDISFRLYRNDGTTTIGAASTFTQSGLYETQVAGLDATNTYLDCILKVSVKKDAGAVGNGKLYALRIVADASPTTTDSTAGFKGQDTATYAEDAPLDAFLLHGVAKNIEAAHAYRLPKMGSFWPNTLTTGGTASRPKVWGHVPLAYPLGLYPVPALAATLALKIRYTCTDATVTASLVLFDPSTGVLSSRTPATSITTTGTASNVTLSADARPFAGRLVLALLLVESSGAGGASKHSIAAGTNHIVSQRLISQLTSISFTNTDRWKLYFDDTGTPPDNPYPNPRAVAYADGGGGVDDAYVLPLFERDDVDGLEDWSGQAYEVFAEKVGYLTLYGFTLTTSSLDPRTALLGALRPAMPAAAPPVRALYQRARAFLEERAPVFFAGVSYDPARLASGGEVRDLWGASERFSNGATTIELGACTIGRYAPWSDDFGSSTAYQADFVAVGLLACVGAQEEGAPIEVSLTVAHAGGTSDAVTVPCVLLGAPARTALKTAQAWGLGGIGTGDNPAYHHLRGAVWPEDLGRLMSGGGLVYFEVPFDDDAGAPADRRLLRLEATVPQVRADTGVSLGLNRTIDLSIHLVAWGVFARGL